VLSEAAIEMRQILFGAAGRQGILSRGTKRHIVAQQQQFTPGTLYEDGLLT
jgi:hypothetical protein